MISSSCAGCTGPCDNPAVASCYPVCGGRPEWNSQAHAAAPTGNHETHGLMDGRLVVMLLCDIDEYSRYEGCYRSLLAISHTRGKDF